MRIIIGVIRGYTRSLDCGICAGSMGRMRTGQQFGSLAVELEAGSQFKRHRADQRIEAILTLNPNPKKP